MFNPRMELSVRSSDGGRTSTTTNQALRIESTVIHSDRWRERVESPREIIKRTDKNQQLQPCRGRSSRHLYVGQRKIAISSPVLWLADLVRMVTFLQGDREFVFGSEPRLYIERETSHRQLRSIGPPAKSTCSRSPAPEFQRQQTTFSEEPLRKEQSEQDCHR